MARQISHEQFKKWTGLKTKQEGLYYAKKYKLKYYKDFPDAEERFLKNIKARVKLQDDEIHMRQIIRGPVLKYLKEKRNKPDAKLVIGKKALTYVARYKAGGNKIKYRDRIMTLTAPRIYEIMRNLRANEGTVLMSDFKINEIKYDNLENANVLEKKKATYVVNDLLLANLNKAARDEGGDEGGEDLYYKGFNGAENVQEFTVYQIPKVEGNRRIQGGFFGYFIEKSRAEPFIIDIMKRYQIYDKVYLDSPQANKDENCLIHSLKLAGVANNKLENLKRTCVSSKIPIGAIRKFSEDNKLNIKVRIEAANNDGQQSSKSISYGKNGDPVITLGLIKDHYFFNEDVSFNAFALKNYENIKTMKNWHLVRRQDVNGRYERKNDSKMSSFNLITQMLENGFFKEITMNRETIALKDYKKINVETIDLDNKEDKYNEIKEREPIKISDHMIEELANSKPFKKLLNNIDDNKRVDIKIAFDFETTTNTEVHKPYMVSCAIYSGSKMIFDVRTFTGSKCAENFLEYVAKKVYEHMESLGLPNKKNLSKKDEVLRGKAINQCFNIILFAHNITYDMQFLMKYVKNYEPIFRASTKICGGSFCYHGLKINFKDTWAIIDCRLDQFQSFFNLKNIKKEIMPYNLYTEKNVVKDMCKIKDALQFITNEADKKEFLKNVEEFKIGNDHFNHIAYAQFYCEMDVKVMMEGYFIFRQWVIDQLEIDIDDFLTISSISDQFFKSRDCYKDCYYINGVARYYIQKTVVGGRCMSSENKKYLIRERLNDFDGVSLYPSAMKRLGEIGGYLKGKPKVIPTDKLNMKFLNKQDGYFARIKVKRLRIERDFPLASIVNDKGIRMFTNDLSDNNVIYINKISLEDLMEFHDLRIKDFEILDGYYFDEGRNDNVLETIQEVFNLRSEYKNAGNPIQNLYKLIMNSAYGKTIMKEQDTQVVYVNNKEERNKVISRDYNDIKIIEKLFDCDKYIIKKRKQINDHTNACHIGSEILAMSKRIMNEVMCLAEDNDIKIYYQDTDSMHIQDSKIEKLNDLFREKYGRELTGKQMGQFHCDFESIFVKVDEKNIVDGKDITDGEIVKNGKKEVKAKSSTKTIILGKKAYIDIVQYNNGDFKPHFRMKGVPQAVVELKSKKYKNLFNLYKDLYEGNTIKFDLLSTNKPVFKFGNGVVSNVQKFKRDVKFEDKHEDEDAVIDYEGIFAEILAFSK